MKARNAFRILGIISYMLIFLQGMLTGLYFGFYLLIALFLFGSPEQFYALLAAGGLFLSIWLSRARRTARSFWLEVLAFILLTAPLDWKLITGPIGMFNYPAFTLPAFLFVLFYMISLFFSYREMDISGKSDPTGNP